MAIMEKKQHDGTSAETQLILQILKEQKEINKIQIKSLQEHMNAGFDTLAAEMREIKEAKKVQNGRVDKLEKVTWANRIIYSYPKLSGLILVIGYLGVSEIIKKINFIELVKKLF